MNAYSSVTLPCEFLDAMTRLDFLIFVRRVMAELEPGTAYEESWHLEVLARALLATQAGDTRRLMINLPPRSMKTIMVSIAFAAWILGHDPTRRIMCVTYSKDVAKAQADLFNRIMRLGWLPLGFPGLPLGRSQPRARMADNSRRLSAGHVDRG